MNAIVPAWKTQSLGNTWFNELDHLLNDLFKPMDSNKGFYPACDLEEDENYILLSFDLSGIKEEDLKVNIENQKLSVSGKRVSHKESKANVRSFSERSFGSFSRSFSLPDTVEVSKIEADYSNGVLKVFLPKKEKEKPQKVDVKVKKSHFFSRLLGESSEK